MRWAVAFIFALFAATSARAADVLVLCYHDVRDDVEGNPMQVIAARGPVPPRHARHR